MPDEQAESLGSLDLGDAGVVYFHQDGPGELIMGGGADSLETAKQWVTRVVYLNHLQSVIYKMKILKQLIPLVRQIHSSQGIPGAIILLQKCILVRGYAYSYYGKIILRLLRKKISSYTLLESMTFTKGTVGWVKGSKWRNDDFRVEVINAEDKGYHYVYYGDAL